MKVYSYFWLLVMAMLLMVVAIVGLGVGSEGWLFYVTEGFAVVTLALLILFYRKVVRPIRIISYGMDLLVQQDFASRLVPVGQHDADRMVTMFNHMMDCLKEQRLMVREQNQFLDLLINASPMGIVTFDSNGRIASANRAAGIMFDRRQSLLNMTLGEIEHPLAAEVAAMNKGDVITVRMSDSRIYKCSMLSYMDSGWAHPFLLMESLTDEVVAAEKRAYGKVIRMIAHEVNNTMCGVGSMLETVASAMDGEHDGVMAGALTACEERCRDLSGFISRFADVVKLPEPSRTAVDLNVFVDGICAFLQTLCTPSGTCLSVRLNAGPVYVNIDTVQFQQVMVNIVKNASESIGSGGNILIEVMDSEEPSLTVTDNGRGISDEVARNLFSPFYSTKPYGNGIGLTLIAEVLKKHDCHFSLMTSPVDGLTRFTIKFPKFY